MDSSSENASATGNNETPSRFLLPLLIQAKLHNMYHLYLPSLKERDLINKLLLCGIISQKWKQVLKTELGASVTIVASIMSVIVIVVELALCGSI